MWRNAVLTPAALRNKTASRHPLRLPQLFQLCWSDPPHAAEPAKIGRKARIGVAGSFSLAGCGPALISTGFPTAAADDSLHVLPGIRRSRRIRARAFLVVGGAINVFTPFGNVAVH